MNSNLNSEINYNYIQNLVKEIKEDLNKLEKKVEKAKNYKNSVPQINKLDLIAAETLLSFSNSEQEPVANRTRSRMKKILK
jgi:chromosome segregation ATPase